jgi:hypothetical protein
MYINNVQVAIIFTQDNEIVLTLGERLKRLKSDYNANFQQLNVPAGAPPEAPRLLLLSSNFNLNIALNRMDMFINIPDQINTDMDACLDYCYKTVDDLAEILISNNLIYNWCGIIISLNYPEKNITRSSNVVGKLLPNILKIDTRGREIASFNFQVGYKEMPFFKNITLSGYNRYHIDFPAGLKNQNYQVKVSDTMIDESGISILLDINNMPQKPKYDFKKDFKEIIEKSKESSKTILDELNLKGIINDQ